VKLILQQLKRAAHVCQTPFTSIARPVCNVTA